MIPDEITWVGRVPNYNYKMYHTDPWMPVHLYKFKTFAQYWPFVLYKFKTSGPTSAHRALYKMSLYHKWPPYRM